MIKDFFLAEGDLEIEGEDLTVELHGGGYVKIPALRGFSGEILLSEEEARYYLLNRTPVMIRGFTKRIERWQGQAFIDDIKIPDPSPDGRSPERYRATFRSVGEWRQD